MNISIEELKILEENFNKNDIIYFQLLLTKLYEISLKIENGELNSEEKQLAITIFKNILDQNELNVVISISRLNDLFEPFDGEINIENKDNFITLFNLILEQWDTSEENIFSYKIKQITEEFINKIMQNINFNNFISVDNNEETENILFEEEYPSLNFEIKNKDYLREYILQKKLIEYKCECCGLTSWQNNPLMLKLYSKNGIYTNTNLNNLIFLCPNCYSQIGE